jgi:hypothetical protein
VPRHSGAPQRGEPGIHFSALMVRVNKIKTNPVVAWIPGSRFARPGMTA